MKYDKEIKGCVYYFFKDCELTKKRSIHKIVNVDFFVNNELINTKKIYEINNYKKYYYICENSYELKLTELNENTNYVGTGKVVGIDGSTLLKFADIEIIYFKPYLKALSSPKKYIFTLIDIYRNLLVSINLLVDKNIINNNINFDSIIVDKYMNPLMSNFSFSIDISKSDIQEYIKHFFIEYDPTYIEWPMEIHILSFLLTNKLHSLSNNNIECIVNDVINHNILLSNFGETIIKNYKNEAVKYFNKYVNKSYDVIITDILQYSHTWDNYALSIMFLRILIGIHKTIEIKNKFIILFMKLLVTNIHSNPSKRLSINDTTNKFEYIIEGLDPIDYKDIINNLMSA